MGLPSTAENTLRSESRIIRIRQYLCFDGVRALVYSPAWHGFLLRGEGDHFSWERVGEKSLCRQRFCKFAVLNY